MSRPLSHMSGELPALVGESLGKLMRRLRRLASSSLRHASCSLSIAPMFDSSLRLPRNLIAVALLAFSTAGIACSSRGLGMLPEDPNENVGGADGGAGGGPGQSVIDCHPKGRVEGTSGSCLPVDPENDCQRCVQTTCCAEQQACNATAPDSACSFGSTLFESRVVEGGEIGCMMECFVAREEAGTFQGTEDDISSCAGQCGASECSGAGIQAPTTALAECILGVTEDSGGCLAECGFSQ